MAAKVAMVAVPTVLGIASIRVYTVSEVPVDGLVSREKLNVYTPVAQVAQDEFVPEQPGVIQKGLTAARETIQPYVRAAQSACSSVKRGSVRLYHTGEDVFYYLKDPPPEFLPRFGTITMAGLLGMFLARKGSRFRRVALPLGLMGAGASVCYPAQAVAVVKVTGKKAFAAGQWSGAAVSSLFASKPRRPAAEDPASASSPAQEIPMPNPESAVPKEASGAESVSAESFPVSDEPAAAPPAEQASSEISPTQTSIDQDPVDGAVSAITASAETSAESFAVESLPVEPSPVESLPVESCPTSDSEAVEDLPPEASTAEASSVEVTPPEAGPAPAAPAESSSPPESSAAAEEAADQPSVPVVESAEPLPESADPTPVAAAAEEETPTTAATSAAPSPPPPSPPPPSEQPAAENSEGGTGFKADPALMDFGQSSPEDEDLYSTRS